MQNTVFNNTTNSIVFRSKRQYTQQNILSIYPLLSTSIPLLYKSVKGEGHFVKINKSLNLDINNVTVWLSVDFEVHS